MTSATASCSTCPTWTNRRRYLSNSMPGNYHDPLSRSGATRAAPVVRAWGTTSSTSWSAHTPARAIRRCSAASTLTSRTWPRTTRPTASTSSVRGLHSTSSCASADSGTRRSRQCGTWCARSPAGLLHARRPQRSARRPLKGAGRRCASGRLPGRAGGPGQARGAVRLRTPQSGRRPGCPGQTSRPRRRADSRAGRPVAFHADLDQVDVGDSAAFGGPRLARAVLDVAADATRAWPSARRAAGSWMGPSGGWRPSRS